MTKPDIFGKKKENGGQLQTNANLLNLLKTKRRRIENKKSSEIDAEPSSHGRAQFCFG